MLVDPLEADEVVRLSQERDDFETGIRALHRAGGRSCRPSRAVIDLHGLTEKLKAKGLLVEE